MVEPVDVNEADAAALDGVDALRGHGFEIVRYRGERGRFTNLRQLDEVPGMAGILDDDIRRSLTSVASSGPLPGTRLTSHGRASTTGLPLLLGRAPG